MSAQQEQPEFEDQLGSIFQKFTGQAEDETEPEETEQERTQRLARGNVAAREGATRVTYSKDNRESRDFVRQLFGDDPA